MPFVKISKPPKHSNKNTGSSTALFEYLDKENQQLQQQELSDISLHREEAFFSHDNDTVLKEEAIKGIDYNKKGLKNNETKFYEMNISFSQKEQAHLYALSDTKENLQSNIKEYTREVMNEYAKNFNRSIEGKPLDGNDLKYYAKIEYNRRYDSNSIDKDERKAFAHNFKIKTEAKDLRMIGEEQKAKSLEKNYIRNNHNEIILPGHNKDGKNLHVHIVVSRRDKSQSMSLSPLANSKGSKNILNGKKVDIGFERDQFKENAESKFDQMFKFDRDKKDHYKELLKSKQIKSGLTTSIDFVRDPEQFMQKTATAAINKVLQTGLKKGMATIQGQDLKSYITSLSPAKKLQLKKTATQQLTKDLMKSGASKIMKGAMPIQLKIAVTALKMSAGIIKQQQKDQSLER